MFYRHGRTVASQQTKAVHDCRGVEVEVCKARLGLARVSVVRGKGPAAGSPAIDDYIRSLEPITDYLTKWSGLVSPHTP